MSLLENWLATFSAKELGGIRELISGRGVCKKHTGGVSLYAAVSLRLEPSEKLEVVDQLSDEQRLRLQSEAWYDEILYGVLDVLLTKPMTPIGRFKLVIESVEYNEMESRKAAFRLAARYAATSCLEHMKFVIV